MINPSLRQSDPHPGQSHLLCTTRGPDETVDLGRRVGESVRSNLFVALSGDLGTGKTTLTQGIAIGLGLTDGVTSPTFTLVNEYVRGRGPQCRRLVHMDVYRLEGGSAAELDGIGFGDLLDDLDAPDDFGLLVLVVEWADRLAANVPADRLEITGCVDEDEPDVRRFHLQAWGEAATEIVQRLTGGV
ncbi:MAG: tRNA (adenosine(37)-N6)-threonylcarbamoyltransferase complex ATPase subunit type 1 TsaE [Caldilineaceae bacterium]|nr:tRNA (adenosine(37)-N6)-threonylcarbamoyltransferase complex ATPase subunit type 1 TsaE [Caldilineaceae bacterium]